MGMNVGSGDAGVTSLLSGERVSKNHARVEACGELDELGSVLGALAAALPRSLADSRQQVAWVQEELLRLGAWVAATPGSPAAGALVPPSRASVQTLEHSVEAMDRGLPSLQGFLLPGGHPSAAWAHVARSVCRRAERRVASVPSPEAIPFLNRLSTWLYALARTCNHQQGVEEVLWKP